LRHDEDDRYARRKDIDLAQEGGGVEIVIAPEIVEGGLVPVVILGAVPGEVEEDGRGISAAESSEAVESAVEGGKLRGPVERGAKDGSAREDLCAEAVIGEEDIEGALGGSEMGGVGIGEVAAGEFAIGEEEDAARRGRDETGDEAQMFLDLGGVVFLIGAAADQQGVDGGGGCGSERGKEEGGAKVQRNVDCACHGRRFMGIMREIEEERKRPSKRE
jgi:hypothetical protein